MIKPSLHRWIGRVPDLSAVIARFPVAAACMAIFTAIWVFTDRWSQHESLGRMLVGLVIAAYLSVIITLAREGQKLSKLIFMQIIPLVSFLRLYIGFLARRIVSLPSLAALQSQL